MKHGKYLMYSSMHDVYPSRILICGFGSIGRRHLRVLREISSDFEIAILRSGRGRPSVEADAAHQIFADLSQAISWKPQAAIICTPASDHLNKALFFAKQAVPLLIEKPIGTGSENPSILRQLIDLSKTVPIEIAYVLRYDPCVAYVTQMLRSGILGHLVDAEFYSGSWLPDWRPGIDYRDSVSARQSLGGGVLLELSHEIDLARVFFGDLKLESAMLSNTGLLDIDVEDQAMLTARASPNVLISIRLNFCSKPSRRVITIKGSSGELVWNLLEGTVRVLANDLEHSESFNSPISADQRYRVQADHFLSCVRKQSNVQCSVSDAIETLKLICAAKDLSSFNHHLC